MYENPTYIDEFLQTSQSTRNLSDKTILAYKSDLQDFINFAGTGNHNDSALMAYVQHMQNERHLKGSTIQRKLVTLKLYYKFLYERKYTTQNYYAEQAFRFKKEKKLPKTLPIKDISKLLTALNNCHSEANTSYSCWLATRNLALYDLLISTGIRIAEASAISINDIIMSERTILIHGKGRKQRLIYISCSDTWANLMRWLKVRKIRPVNDDKLFLNRYGGKLGIHGIEYIYKTLSKAAGLKCHSTPHYLRHTFATNLLANGADLRSVQEILGHSSVSTTEIYTEVTNKRKKQVMNRFNYRNKL